MTPSTSTVTPVLVLVDTAFVPSADSTVMVSPSVEILDVAPLSEATSVEPSGAFEVDTAPSTAPAELNVRVPLSDSTVMEPSLPIVTASSSPLPMTTSIVPSSGLATNDSIPPAPST